VAKLDNAEKKVAHEIIDALGEKNKGAHGTIYRLVEHGGIQFTENLMRDTLETEEQGGLMTLDGERRRSIGGVFFHLAKQRVPEEHIQTIFYPWQKKKQEAVANSEE
jgi:PHAX RNA-binding domain-containing protein